MHVKGPYVFLLILVIVFGSYGLETLGVGWNTISPIILATIIAAIVGPRLFGNRHEILTHIEPRQLDAARFLLGLPSGEEREREEVESTVESEEEIEPQEASAIFTMPIPLQEQKADLRFGLDQKLSAGYASGLELNLAPNLRVHPDTLFSGRVLVAGMPGSGKSNTMRHLIEESGKREIGLPFLLIDTDGEYSSLLKILSLSMVVGRSNRLHIPSSRFVQLHTLDAQEFGTHIIRDRLQAIFDVKSYISADGETDETEAAKDFMAVLRGMRQWQESTPTNERIPSMVFLEEAQVWLPQQNSSSTLSPDVRHHLMALFSRNARDGRRRGIGTVIVAHRIAGIAKEVLQCEWMFLHRPQATDIRRYAELVPYVHRERFLHLRTGRAIVVSPEGTREVSMHKAASEDGGPTPGIAQLLGSQTHRVRESRRRQFRTEELEAAATKWKAGANSVRKLERALRIPFEDARQLRLQLMTAGMIETGNLSD